MKSELNFASRFLIPTIRVISLEFNCLFNLIDDAADMGVSNPGAGGEADTDFEERFADAVGVGGSVAIDRLLVHRFPEGTRFDAGGVEVYAQGLYVIIGLAVRGY